MVLFNDNSGATFSYHQGIYSYKGCDIVGHNIGFWQKFRVVERLFRLLPRLAIKYQNNQFLVASQGGVYLLNFNDLTKSLIQAARCGFTTPLAFSEFSGAIYWGEYGDNPARTDVNIFKYTQNEGVKIAHTFRSGEIRHIHNIIHDEYRHCFWIFTGDNEPNSGIWWAKEDFSSVLPILTGKQQYRAVIGFATPEGLIYATDAVEEDNYVYMVKICLDKIGSVTQICPINGSCIYGTELRDYYIFSTTVEPHEGRGLLNLFSYRLGRGIKSRYASVIAIRKTDYNVKTILTIRKDWLPMKLFQYGSIQFPGGQNFSNELTCNIVACEKFDGNTMKLLVE